MWNFFYKAEEETVVDVIIARKVTEMDYEKNSEVFRKPGLAEEFFEDKRSFKGLNFQIVLKQTKI